MAFAEHYAVCGTVEFNHTSMMFAAMKRPTFADRGELFGPAPWEYIPNYVHPVTSGSPPVTRPSTPGVTFQVRPLAHKREPSDPALPNECDPNQPQTPHRGGMIVGLADGSTRIVRHGIAPEVFWAATTPAGGETLGEW
jgi:hypothetical protein